MSNGAQKGFDFQSLGIASVLKLHKLAIPPHQREYAWDADQVGQLYTDLQQAKSENNDYFLGTIVTIPTDNDKTLEIVDGQQRLTTTAILLAAIRDYLLENEDASIVVESIENEFLSTIDRSMGQRVARLKLNVDDNAFFQDLIGQRGTILPPVPSRESHQRLIEASKVAREMVQRILAPFGAPHRVDALNEWLEFVEHNATVVLLKAPDGAQAFRMFETLNDRGLKTSQVDLVKSYLFGQAHRRIGEAQAKWSSMRNMLEEIEDEDRGINFLRHALIATRGFTRADEVYSTVQKHVRGETNSAAFLSDLEALSRIYVATFRAEAEQWNGYPPAAIQALRVLNKFDIKPLRPLILALAKALSPVEAGAAYQYLVSLSVRLLVASTTRSGSIEESIAAAALEVFTGKITDTKGLKEKLLRITPDDRAFSEAFATITVSKPDYARYYLRTLERALADEKEPWTLLNEDPTQITLEHIFPKTPDLCDWPKFDADTAARYLRRMGNLCLMQKTPNSNAGNDKFEIKRPLYKDSPYAWTNGVFEVEEWSPKAIEERQALMAQIVTKGWPI